MDDRIKDIKEGVGREESRLNQDFIDFLQKWSTPVLFVIAGLALAYWAWGQYGKMQIAKVNEATAEYTAAATDGNPDRLAPVAEKYASVRSFGILAKLDMADAYLLSAQRGLVPGLVFMDAASLVDGDVLDDEARTTNLERARRLYQEVLDTAGKAGSGKELLGIEAAFGLAAVAESLDDGDSATRALERALTLAEGAGFADLARAASARMESLNTGTPRQSLFSPTLLPPLPQPPKPELVIPPLEGEGGTPEIEADPPADDLPPADDDSSPTADDPGGAPSDEPGDGR